MVKAAYIFHKLLSYSSMIFVILTFNFFLIRLMPGDPLLNILGEDDYYSFEHSNPQRLEELRASYGLDKSMAHQYAIYLNDVAHLDFGMSYHYNRPVLDLILFRTKWTMRLVLPATAISALLGLLAGRKAGWRYGGLFERGATPFFIVVHTVPTYCLAIIFLSLFSYKLGLFPIGGMSGGGVEGIDKLWDTLLHMALPLAVLVMYRTSYNYLIMRNSVMSVKNEDYVVTAYSKGLTDRRVLNVHVMKNAVLPYITVVCMQFGSAVAGTMTLEVIFSWNGMGRLIYDAVTGRDFPILQTSFLIITICVIAANFAADMLYAVIDPRIREGSAFD